MRTGLHTLKAAILPAAKETPPPVVAPRQTFHEISREDMLNLPVRRYEGEIVLVATPHDLARARGCCKLTLEVLSGNALAMRSYARFGFANYQLDPAAGQAVLMQKWL